MKLRWWSYWPVSKMLFPSKLCPTLTHWGRVTHICVGNLTIIGPNNCLSPGRRQAIIWNNTGILLIAPWGTNFSENFNRYSNIFIRENAFENVVCEMASILIRPQCVKDAIVDLAQRERRRGQNYTDNSRCFHSMPTSEVTPSIHPTHCLKWISQSVFQ